LAFRSACEWLACLFVSGILSCRISSQMQRQDSQLAQDCHGTCRGDTLSPLEPALSGESFPRPPKEKPGRKLADLSCSRKLWSRFASSPPSGPGLGSWGHSWTLKSIPFLEAHRLVNGDCGLLSHPSSTLRVIL
jgi:hypothetical protein